MALAIRPPSDILDLRLMDALTRSAAPQERTAYVAIETKIVLLEFRPGAMLTEKAIIDAVGIGRTPVREAIQRLTLEGLMEVHPRLGVKIAEIRPEDYRRAVEPRLTLEPLLARSAARYAGPHDRQAILEGGRLMVESARNNDIRGFLYTDKLVDEILSSASANPFLPRVLAPLQTHSRRFWYQYHGAHGMLECSGYHLRACEAIASGDSERAEQASRQLAEYLFEQAAMII